ITMNALRLERLDDGVVVLHLDDPEDRVNKLSQSTLSQLEDILQGLETDASIGGMILISDKKDSFIVGADIKMFDELNEPGPATAIVQRVQNLFTRLENLPFPVLAAIHGPCLGGGLELVLACHFRIATDHPKTILGLPEVKLGLLPAAGGTQRLTRQAGVKRALPLMLEGRTMDAKRAKSLGIIDKVVYPFDLLESAKRCLAYYSKRIPRIKHYPAFPSMDWAVRQIPPVRNLFFNLALKQIEKQTQGNYPAPPRIVECIDTGLSRGMAAGLEKEGEAFNELVCTPESQALRHLFFASTSLKKNPLADKVRSVRRVGVLGSGFMGSGIATVTAQGGVPVTLKDVSWTNLAGGLKNVWTNLDQRVRRRRGNPVERDRQYSLVAPTVDYAALAGADLVIEAVYEDIGLKQQVLREVEEHAGPECIFASNTSAIPISRIAEASKHPETVVGMHYFSPVTRMPLLEVVVTDQTADWVTATATAIGQQQGKTVIVVKDGPGFYTSRILGLYAHEAVSMLHEGADIIQADQAMRQFGFPVGPFKLLDEVGIDIAVHVSKELHEYFGSRGFGPPASLEQLLKDGYQGRKNGKGFYDYTPPWWRAKLRFPGLKAPRPVNEAIYEYFGGKKRKVIDILEIQERLVLMMVNEAVLCLQEGIIASTRDGDVGAVLGLGFPPFLGGPFHYLDKLGVNEAVIKLERLADKFGPRFQPAALLVEKATRGESFT
ncbi:MAG: 3-hydroxyacyl-CoA dehydrogenase NAD-binding domain-containing protein, partial [Acidobacteriota bacterium]